MKQLCIFLSVMFLLFACATKRKTKDVEKTEIKTENVIHNDSVFQLKTKVSKIETNQTFNEFEKVLKALNVQYDGEQGNDLKVLYNRTDKGTELNVSGKGKATLNEQTEQIYSLTKQDVLSIYDSLKKFEIKQNKVERSERLVDSFKSDTEKQKNDVSIWVYVIIGCVLCLVICLGFVMIQINHIKKYTKIMGG
ncbi:Uncharacterised protein [Algoriella xinjiangensis]|uniref:hypothetical protein n=1 Tax=Algoriella xinjiangensis TaxID=684065 RepID=UPI000F641221|nr:hypothetical protein [Algoriella xinjiangensis]VDH16095.1 Uncharacterised protein [Algoriella xinjiangensis]